MSDSLDQRIVRATQAGLPLVPEPYRKVAEDLGVTQQDVLQCINRMVEDGRIRRIGAVPNHYAIGYVANGMSVWDVDDAQVTALGRAVGALNCVSHCYRRPRHPPEWPYNLFAMVHGRDRAEVVAGVAQVAALLGNASRGHDVLYSKRILKKTGLRFG
ncbi:MAG: Lrp/AsnC family transcriptional regulator [Betaproteobacteria bacterium]|nr:Lrp/AsnC family transcriptional regulator [Betaproteobacteria bacterium]